MPVVAWISLSRLLVTATVILCLSVLTGWLLHIPLLYQWGEGRFAMPPLTAINLFILSLVFSFCRAWMPLNVDVLIDWASLSDVRSESDQLRLRRILLSQPVQAHRKYLLRFILVPWLFLMPWAIHLIKSGQLPSWAYGWGMLPAIQACFCLWLLAIAIFLLTWQRIWVLGLAQVLLLMVITIALSGLIGHLFNTKPLLALIMPVPDALLSVGIAMPATVGFLLLAFAMLIHTSKDFFLTLPVRIFSSFQTILALIISLITLPILVGWFLTSIDLTRNYGRDATLALLIAANILLQLPIILHVASRLLMKELKLKTVVNSLEKALAEKDKLAKELQELSNRDALTGLHNRRYFEFEMARSWRRAIRTHQPISLFFIDVDYFKPYNDCHGHQKGDACLMCVADLISQTVNRGADVVARYGGEEFVVLLPDTPLAGAVDLAEKLRSVIESAALPHGGSLTAPVVTISLGVASIVPERESQSADLLRAADEALYQAKAAGRNRFFIAGNDND